MVKLRLKRMGSKYNAFYRIVAADERFSRDGKFIEEIGYYNPHSKEIRINKEVKDKWIAQGAGISLTVKSLFAKVEKLNLASNEVGYLPKKPKQPKKPKKEAQIKPNEKQENSQESN